MEWLFSELLNRSEYISVEPQDVVLLVTIREVRSDLPVYGELVTEMDRLGWGAMNLEVRSRERLR